MNRRAARGSSAICLIFGALFWAQSACAHPMVENALDVVIARDRITMVALVSPEEVRLTEPAETAGASTQLGEAAVRGHGEYLLKHFHVRVDDRLIGGRVVQSKAPGESRLVRYELEYELKGAPKLVRIDQDLLREFTSWSASCIVRIRQENQEEFQTALLTRDRSVEYDCDWSVAAGGAATQPAQVKVTRTDFWPTLRDYFRLGVNHILEGFDHLLFVSALVLAATRLWDLVKVVTAFTLAHTLTLTLSVLNIVTLPERIVEPMIAASIVFVAVQNIFWPRSRTGWTRTAVAFAFGLFHGLGFAGGLKDAMGDMPGASLGAALAGFSLGVEAGHQVVVVPLFGVLFALRHWGTAGPRIRLAHGILRYGSCAISLAGMVFLIRALRWY